MNQILVTQKIYVTPELRRKKKMYKIQFFLSVFLACLLFSYYIYAEYDRDKSEEVSQEILSGIRNQRENQDSIQTQAIATNTNNVVIDNTVRKTDNIIIVAIDEDIQEDPFVAVTRTEQVQEEQTIQEEETQPVQQEYITKSGITYNTEAILRIESLGIDYPILSDTSEELLKISLNKYWGPAPNEVGNYCVVGHNYKNKKMFGRLSEIVNGDIVELEDMNGRTVKYAVYDKYVVDPDDTSCTSQLTNGRKEITLITCKEYGTKRLVVKAREVK